MLLITLLLICMLQMRESLEIQFHKLLINSILPITSLKLGPTKNSGDNRVSSINGVKIYESNGAYYISRQNNVDDNNVIKLFTNYDSTLNITSVNTATDSYRHIMSADAIFGVYFFEDQYYLALITKSADVHGLGNIVGVKQIKEIRFLPIYKPYKTSQKKKSKDTNNPLKLLLDAISRHTFYYSTSNYDITRSSQSNYHTPNNSTSVSWQYSDDRFFWNYNLISPFIEANIDESWIIPVTNAWITSETITPNFCNDTYILSLISRRSRFRQGPRYIKRGIDKNGNVANLVENEQLLYNIDTKQSSSFIQVRGSIPLFWKQPETWQVKPSVYVAQDIHTNTQAIKTHLYDLSQRHTYRSTIVDNNANKHDHSDNYNTENTDLQPSQSITFINLIDKHKFQGNLGRWLTYCLYKAQSISIPLLCQSDENDLIDLDNLISADMDAVDSSVCEMEKETNTLTLSPNSTDIHQNDTDVTIRKGETLEQWKGRIKSTPNSLTKHQSVTTLITQNKNKNNKKIDDIKLSYIEDYHQDIYMHNESISTKYLNRHQDLYDRNMTSIHTFNISYIDMNHPFTQSLIVKDDAYKSLMGTNTTTTTTNTGDMIGNRTIQVKYIWYDYHHQCHGNPANIHSLYSSLEDILCSNNLIFVKDIATTSSNSGNNVKQQKHIIRTNCIDCLDRTNVIQTAIARWALMRQFSALSSTAEISETWNTSDVMTIPDKDIERIFRSMWADNGDNISFLYAGTNALKRDVTRTGRRTKRGAIDDGVNSAKRYFINNYEDRDKQIGIDLLLGYINDKTTIGPIFKKKNNIMSISSTYKKLLNRLPGNKVHTAVIDSQSAELETSKESEKNEVKQIDTKPVEIKSVESKKTAVKPVKDEKKKVKADLKSTKDEKKKEEVLKKESKTSRIKNLFKKKASPQPKKIQEIAVVDSKMKSEDSITDNQKVINTCDLVTEDHTTYNDQTASEVSFKDASDSNNDEFSTRLDNLLKEIKQSIEDLVLSI